MYSLPWAEIELSMAPVVSPWGMGRSKASRVNAIAITASTKMMSRSRLPVRVGAGGGRHAATDRVAAASRRDRTARMIMTAGIRMSVTRTPPVLPGEWSPPANHW